MPADVAEIIASDHRKVEELFDQLESGQGDRRRLADQVISALSAHTAAEEQVVYPAVRDAVPDGRAMADKAISEHKVVKDALAKLEQTQPGEREFDSAITTIIDGVRDHIPEEENELLPALREVIGEDKMRELGGTFEQVKGSVPKR